jgi:arylsulfatase A-like enzyme
MGVLGSSRATAGAVWGIVFWSAYGIVEYFLYSVVPLFQRSSGVFTMTAWKLTGVLFDCYWILGAICGALFTVAFDRWDRTSFADCEDEFECGRRPAALSLLVAVCLNLVRSIGIGHYGLGMLGVAAALGIAIVWCMRRPGSRLAQWVDYNPFLLGLLLLGPLWVAAELMDPYSFPIRRLMGGGLCLIAVPIFNRLLRQIQRWPAHLHFVSGMAVLAIIVVTSGFKSGERQQFPGVSVPSMADPGRPPVILVSLDTTRADHTSLASYSRNTTPKLAEFAREATVFPNAVAAYDMTLGSHASMFTGVYPSWHGAMLNGGRPQPLGDRLPTMAGILSRKGYFTAAIVANTAFLTRRWGLARGFHLYDTKSSVTLMAGEWPFELRQGLRALLDYFIPTSDFDLMFRSGEQINSAAFRTLADSAVRDRSFLLFVNYMDAHSPFLPPAPYDTQYLGDQPRVPFSKYQATRQHNDACSRGELSRLAAEYDGGIAYQDQSFGQLVQWLKERGIYDRALIIVTGDHGEVLGERGQLGHGISVYADELNVPLLVKYPHQTSGSVVAAPASHVDLLPTVLDVVGYEIPQHVQGRTLRDAVNLEHRAVLGESDSARALVVDGWKLIAHANGRRELYAVDRDRAEARNLYGTGAAGSDVLEAALRQFEQRLPKAAAQDMADPAEVRKLKSLGYLQ